jgi:hypothetical protein
VVNTLVALPDLPSLNLPKLPPVTVPAPPSAGGPPSVGGGTTGVQAPGPTGQPTRGSTVSGIPGDAYTYNTGRGAPQMSPGSAIAASGFDASRYVALSDGAPGSGPAGSAGSAGSGGSGGQPGSYDGAPAPAFGLNGTRLSEDGAQRGGAPATLPGAALAAVIALAAVTSALVRTHRAARGTR